jgi:hypothetical protein
MSTAERCRRRDYGDNLNFSVDRVGLPGTSWPPPNATRLWTNRAHSPSWSNGGSAWHPGVWPSEPDARIGRGREGRPRSRRDGTPTSSRFARRSASALASDRRGTACASDAAAGRGGCRHARTCRRSRCDRTSPGRCVDHRARSGLDRRARREGRAGDAALYFGEGDASGVDVEPIRQVERHPSRTAADVVYPVSGFDPQPGRDLRTRPPLRRLQVVVRSPGRSHTRVLPVGIEAAAVAPARQVAFPQVIAVSDVVSAPFDGVDLLQPSEQRAESVERARCIFPADGKAPSRGRPDR